MEEYILYFCIAIISVIVLYVLWFLQSSKPKVTDRHEEEPEEVAEQRPVRPQRMAGNARSRMRMAQAQRQQDRPPGSDDSTGEDEETAAEPGFPAGKMGKKKLAKLQLKAEKRVKREADEREREERKAEEEKQWELRKIQDAKEKEEEKLKELEEQRRKEDEARKEQEEYEQFKQQFSVQEEGYDETQDEQQEENLLKDFIEYIFKSKVVVLEELAALFKLKTQSVINRIIKLQEDGRITGVLDDRGKFIYISREELDKVAKFIRQRGRVSLTEIAEASNQLINLNSEIVLEV